MTRPRVGMEFVALMDSSALCLTLGISLSRQGFEQRSQFGNHATGPLGADRIAPFGKRVERSAERFGHS